MKRHLKQVSIAIAIIAVLVSLPNLSSLVSATVPGTNQFVSLRSTGTLSNLNSSVRGIISANGKVVVFQSYATNILPSGGMGIFERNLATGTITRINVSTAGAVDNDSGRTIPQKVSATGRYVLMQSFATNLIDGTTLSTSNPQLYLRDVATSTTTLVSQNATGTISNGSTIDSLGVSSDGRFVAFTTNASNLDSTSTDGNPHLYMLDRSNNTLTIIDKKTDGSLGTTNSSWSPQGSMSCDGSLITFIYPSNLIVGDAYSNHVDVYLLDRRGGVDKLTNITKSANAAGLGATISCNGDFIGFKSTANNLDTSVSATLGWYRPYIYDRVNATYHVASITTSNTTTNSHICGSLSNSNPCIQLSDTGIGVFSANESLLTGTTGTQIYLRDIYNGTTELVSRDSTGTPGNDSSTDPYISEDGTITSYTSAANNLLSGDTNSNTDVFTSLTGY